MRTRWAAWVAAVVLMAGTDAAAADPRPSVIFILLDTTRADRFGAWGNPRPTTPALDHLAAEGVRFVRHHANSHSTRSSMPQLMSGRYFHPNVLARFEEDAHPREMSFQHADPTAVLLPALFAGAGYTTIGISAHTWVAAESALGRPFTSFELLPFTNEEAHGDARPLVDRAIAAWRARTPGQPVFLYLHFMDMHMPRRLPEAEPRFPVPGYDWRSRFRASGEPDFGRERRRWVREDAADFTAADRAHFAAVYDTRLQYTDEQLARLFAVVREADPTLRDTLVVVTADHGEELGEEGRTDHSDSLADGVQHVPWLVAGAGVPGGQQCTGRTEHVDVLPTLVAVLGLVTPAGARVDGMARLDRDGRIGSPCGTDHATYAWETYRGIRAHRYLLREHPAGTSEAACANEPGFYRVDGTRRSPAAGSARERKAAALAQTLATRLDARQRAFEAERYDPPTRAFLWRTAYWRTRHPVACVPVTADLTRSALRRPGWFWSGRGLLLLDATAAEPLDVTIDVPPGAYQVDLAARPIDSPPWLFGVARWSRKALLPSMPTVHLPVATVVADRRPVQVSIPAALARGHHVLGLRLTPEHAAPSEPARLDRDQEERLRALGYVE
jgi:arylsulfatase A-like enzyme